MKKEITKRQMETIEALITSLNSVNPLTVELDVNEESAIAMLYELAYLLEPRQQQRIDTHLKEVI